jgi:hypothetical protein
MLRLIGVLPEVRVMTLLAIQSRITLILLKVEAVRCDEGYHA